MTPAGLPAAGSPLCAAAGAVEGARATSSAVSPTTGRAARIGDNVGISTIGEEISPRIAAQRGPTAAPGPAPRAAVAVAPVAVALILLSIAVLSNGAFALRQWGPIAFFGLVTLAFAPHNRLRGAALAMVIATWGFALWSLLSITWADAPGRAVEGAGRNLLYATLVSLPLVTLPDRRSALRMTWALTAGLAAVVVLTFAAALADGPAQFLAGRLNDPVGYRNATAALMGMAFWPLVCLAAQRGPNPLVRAAAFSVATLGARPRLPHAVARRAARLLVRSGRGARAGARPRAARVAVDHGRRGGGDRQRAAARAL